MKTNNIRSTSLQKSHQAAKLHHGHAAAGTGACEGVGGMGLSMKHILKKSIQRNGFTKAYLFAAKKSPLLNTALGFFLIFGAQIALAQTSFKIIGVAPTVLVDESTEPIPNYLNESNLPKNLSLGWRTKQEIYDLKKMLIEGKLIGPKSCMGWIYMRGEKDDRLVSIHTSSQHGVAKLNSTYRAAYLTFIKAYSTIDNPTYLEATTSKTVSDVNGGYIDPSKNWQLVLDITNSDRLAPQLKSDVKCTFLDMRCRRYEFKNKSALLWRMPRSNPRSDEATHLEIRDLQNKPIQFFIEETCPGTRYGFFVSGDGHRMGATGDFIDALTGGIVFNRDPLKALLKDLKK